MTLEEAKAKIAELEAENAKLQAQVKNQNSYITKLEAQAKVAPNTTGGSSSSLDPVTQKYLEKNMIKDTIAEARENIVKQVGLEIYNAIEPDLNEWLKANMKIQNCTVEFVEDSFNLIYGRCFRNKEHKIHEVIGKDSNPQPVTPTPTPQTPVTPTNPTVLNQPPVINNRDGFPSTPPTPQATKTKKDIFSDFGRKLAAGGNNPFQ